LGLTVRLDGQSLGAGNMSGTLRMILELLGVSAGIGGGSGDFSSIETGSLSAHAIAVAVLTAHPAITPALSAKVAAQAILTARVAAELVEA
jgi:hypothetical protein